MQALGLIETRGLIPAIVSADAMVKAANVKLLEKTCIGSGLVTITVVGDVGAVQAAVEAASGVVKDLNQELLISQHIIPRPHEELEGTILSSTPLIEGKEQLKTIVEDKIDKIEEIVESKKEVKVEEKTREIEETVEIESQVKSEDKAEDIVEDNVKNIKLGKPENKEDIDSIIAGYGLEKGIQKLKKLKVIELRDLARKYDDFGIKGRDISKAGKDLLIKEFKKYYENN